MSDLRSRNIDRPTISAPSRGLDRGDADLLHRHHRLERALRHRRPQGHPWARAVWSVIETRGL